MSTTIICTTIHVQDLEDEAGDRAMGRQTAVIKLGQTPTRTTILAFVVAWSLYLPVMWGLPLVLRVPYGALGILLGTRFMALRRVEDDRKSFRIYNVRARGFLSTSFESL